jgi:type 1 fimbriae regulatory protein FimB/type 1 fimbriae regulatory protein FimE
MRIRDMALAELLPFPATGNTKGPRRRPNTELRPREHLTPNEVEQLIAIARARGRGRCRQRDAAAILICYSHGLRVSELVSLRWSQFDLNDGVVHIKRAKNGRPSTQPLRGPELRALRQLRRLWPDGQFVLQTESETPWTEAGFRKMLARTGEAAGFPFTVHPHQLRHACGYKLANDGVDTRTIQAYLGHANITHTVRYTELAAERFNGLWPD